MAELERTTKPVEPVEWHVCSGTSVHPHLITVYLNCTYYYFMCLLGPGGAGAREGETSQTVSLGSLASLLPF